MPSHKTTRDALENVSASLQNHNHCQRGFHRPWHKTSGAQASPDLDKPADQSRWPGHGPYRPMLTVMFIYSVADSRMMQDRRPALKADTHRHVGHIERETHREQACKVEHAGGDKPAR